MSSEPPTIKVAFFNVGQGDTTVVSSPETREAFVIDCVDAQAVLDYLEDEGIAHLRGVIITHLHADHYAQVAQLLSNLDQVPGLGDCEVLAVNWVIASRATRSVLLSDADSHSSAHELTPERSRKSTYETLVDWCARRRDQYSGLAIDRRSLPFAGKLASSLRLLHPHGAILPELQAKGINNASIVLRVGGSGASALLAGDLEPVGWKELVNSHGVDAIRSDVLKFPHHGAWRDADASELLNLVDPSLVVISVGTEGWEKYGHPNPHVFDSIRGRARTKLLCTQATAQCDARALEKRSAVVRQFTLRAAAEDSRFSSGGGCPCAGTVVVELGKTVRVLRPDTTFHTDQIIRVNFANPKCLV